MGNKPAKSKPIEPEELMRQMEQNPDVVVEYYRSRQHLITKFVENNLWEEDVNEWLNAIRKRSPKTSLQVRKVDFLKAKNTKENNTSKYKNTALVIRRASFFDVDVHFGDRHFDPDRDDLSVHLSLGANPSVVTKTKVVCPVVPDAGETSQWFCQITGDDEVAKKLSLRINVPADAIVARYAFSLEIVSGTAEGRVTSEHKNNSVIVLFNPLSEDDTVYMEDERMRNEYVFADKGFVNLGSFWGTVESCQYQEWNFAQFDQDVLDSVLLLLHNDSRSLQEPEKSYKRRNDPVYVSRVLSAMVNCADDKGVIMGRWDGEYDDGKSPGTWNHSGKMLEEWRDNDMAPVKYGQCWVFSGLLTTVLRAVGIPARSITNYSSAHDTNQNVTIDYYYDIDSGERVGTSDSIWNFHVWNEAYFDRPDLPEGYGGWQVVDATPQELSQVEMGKSRKRALYQCGPAPVNAIKNGEINVGFDSNFIFGEVNADKVTWTVQDGKIVGQPKVNKSAVGICIATKAIGEMRTEDITLTYKYKEGTKEERIAFKKAYGRATREHAGYFGNDAVIVKPTYEITVTGNGNGTVLGSTVKTTIKIKNLSEKTSSTSLKISAKSKRHVGVLHKLLKKEVKDFTLEAGKAKKFTFELSYVEYVSGLVDDRVINILALATDTEDGNTVTEELDLTFKLPKCISVDIPKTISKEKDTEFSITFENKLPFPLTGGMFEIWFTGVSTTKTDFTVEKPILPGESYKIGGISLTPNSDTDEFNGTIAFESREVNDMLYNVEGKLE